MPRARGTCGEGEQGSSSGVNYIGRADGRDVGQATWMSFVRLHIIIVGIEVVM
jgi:hypothetical protein